MTVETCFSKFNWLSISIPKGVTDEKGAKKGAEDAYWWE